MKNDINTFDIPSTPGLPVPVSEIKSTISDSIQESDTAPPKVLKERCYILYYRYAKIPSLFKIFNYRGNLQDAILRGRQHCLKMGYLFILVLPFLVDLDDQETRKAQDPANFDDESSLTMRL